MIEFPCQTCHSVLRTPAGTEGKQSRCPHCGMIQTIPGGLNSLESASFQPPNQNQDEGRRPSTPPQPNSASPDQLPNQSPHQSAPSPFQQPASHPAHPNPSSYNPYETPGGYQKATPRQQYYQNRATEKIKGPAVSMLVTHILITLFNSLAFFGGLMNLIEGTQPPEESYLVLVFCGGTVLMSMFGIFGCVCMLQQKFWGVGLATAIVTILSGLACCFLPTAFGIWGIVILLDPDVKNSFQKPANSEW